MTHMDRKLTVRTDGALFAEGCCFHLSGKTGIGLFPSLFLLQCRNLSDTDVFRLRNTKELSVYRDDSCLAFGRVSDVYRETVQEGTITTVAFSLGLDLWESQVSVSVPARASVSETVRMLLDASGTGIQLLSFPGEDSVFSRANAFCGRAAECIATALTAARAKGYLVPAGLCIVPVKPLEPTLHLTKTDLTDAPMIAAGGTKMILSTSVTGFQPGEEMTLEVDGEHWRGLILERMVEADTAYGDWKTQLVIQLR